MTQSQLIPKLKSRFLSHFYDYVENGKTTLTPCIFISFNDLSYYNLNRDLSGVKTFEQVKTELIESIISYYGYEDFIAFDKVSHLLHGGDIEKREDLYNMIKNHYNILAEKYILYLIEDAKDKQRDFIFTFCHKNINGF